MGISTKPVREILTAPRMSLMAKKPRPVQGLALDNKRYILV